HRGQGERGRKQDDHLGRAQIRTRLPVEEDQRDADEQEVDPGVLSGEIPANSHETNDDDEESHPPRNLLSPASPGQPQPPSSEHQRTRSQRVHVELPSQENAPTHDEDAAAESLGHEHERSNPSWIDRRTRCTQTGKWPHASLRGLALTDILDRAESLY